MKGLTADFLNESKKKEDDFYELEQVQFELSAISDPKIRALVTYCLSKAPAFWAAPVSNDEDGVYPSDEYEVGGLVLHTTRAVRMFMLMEASVECSQEEKDCAIAALLLRNLVKFVYITDKQDELAFDPIYLYMVDPFLTNIITESQMAGEDIGAWLGVSPENINMILRLIRTSGGYLSLVPETQPATFLEKTVHFADLAVTMSDTIKDIPLFVFENEQDDDDDDDSEDDD